MHTAHVNDRNRRANHVAVKPPGQAWAPVSSGMGSTASTNPALLEHLEQLDHWKRELLDQRHWWATALAVAVSIIPLLELLYILPLTFVLCLSPRSRVGGLWKDSALPYLEWVEDHEIDLLEGRQWHSILGARLL